MLKKKKSVSIALAFALSAIFLLSSCAKKQVRVEEERAEPPAREEERVEKAPEAREEPREDTSALERAEAERQQRIGEMEAARRLRMEVQAFESEIIYFDFDKSDLKPEARAVLTKKAAWLRENPTYSVRIEGHCDDRGTNEYNLALGERRANAAWKFLNALGISGERLSTISYGEERPADPGHNETAWAKNRRDEFKLMK